MIGAVTASRDLSIFGLEKKKSSQIVNNDIYFQFSLLFILCVGGLNISSINLLEINANFTDVFFVLQRKSRSLVGARKRERVSQFTKTK